jgi:hypothetical protein
MLLPPEEEVLAAIGILSRSPVHGYAPFDEEEVRLIAAYRVYASRGAIDVVWRGISEGDWNSWIYAIHEAAEIQTFADMGFNVFDRVAFDRHLSQAHLHATLVELRYIQQWAGQVGLDTPELALETENPMRKQFPELHRALLTALAAHQGWSAPSTAELQTARAFWEQIRTGG